MSRLGTVAQVDDAVVEAIGDDDASPHFRKKHYHRDR